MNHRAHPVPNRSALFRFVAIFIALIAAAAATACGSGSSSDQGAEAPDFSLPVANGAGKITLSHYQGDKNVILVFYRGHF